MKKLFFSLSLLFVTSLYMSAQVDATQKATDNATTKVVNAMDELTPGEKVAAADPNITVKTCQHSGKQSFYRKNADGTTTVMQYDVERNTLVPVLDKEGKEVTFSADKKSCSKSAKTCSKGDKKACCKKGAKTCSKGDKKACCKKGAKTCSKGDKVKDATPASQPKN